MKEANSESDNHCKNLRKRKAFLDYSEDNDLFEEHQVYDCCFIKVTGSIYGRWKRVRDQLKLQNDEDLVVHLLDFYQDLRDRYTYLCHISKGFCYEFAFQILH